MIICNSAKICTFINDDSGEACRHSIPHTELFSCKQECKNPKGVIGSRCITMEEHVRRRAKEYFKWHIKAKDFLI